MKTAALNVLPPYLSPGQIARANGISRYVAQKKCERAGILEADGPHRWHVSSTKLRERLDEMYGRVFDYFVEEGHDLDDPED